MAETTVLKDGQVVVLNSVNTCCSLKIFEEDGMDDGVYTPPKFIRISEVTALQQFLNTHLPSPELPVTQELWYLRNILQGIRDFMGQPMTEPQTAAQLITWLESTTGFVLEAAAGEQP